MALASQAWAAETWVACTGANSGYCKWDSSCSEIKTCTGGSEGSDCANAGTDCAAIYKNCLDNSPTNSIYNDNDCTTVKEKGTIQSCGDYCDWGSGGCWEIKTSATSATCELAKAACDKDGVRWSGAGCEGTQLGGIQSCGKWCKWPTGCTEIKPDPEAATPPTTTCEQAIANCSANGKLFDTQAACNASSSSAGTQQSSSSNAAQSSSSSVNTQQSSSSAGTQISSSSISTQQSSSSSDTQLSSSSNGTDPIIAYNNAPVIGLNVTHFARSLKIASGKNATVALFDMRGKQVLSQKVFSGTTTISLEKQRQGIYYAVVKSDSHKQTVKIVLK